MTRVRVVAEAITATIPERRDQRVNRLRRCRAGGCLPVFDRTAYKCRNIVERCFNRLKRLHTIAAF